MKTVLRTVSLSKTFDKADGQIQALTGCNLSFQKGSYTAVIGEAGAGKSTLLRLLGGLEVPTSGTVFLEGKEISKMHPYNRHLFCRQRVGFVSPFSNLISHLTVIQNILLSSILFGIEPDHRYISQILEILELGNQLKAYVGQLSEGQQQMVAVARALAAKPAVLLVDEPTVNLPIKACADLLELLHLSHRYLNQTLILTTKDNIIASGADRQIILKDGLVDSDTGGGVEYTPILV